MADAFIVDAIRTAGGRRGGALSQIHPGTLGAIVLDQLVERTGIDPAAIEDVIMGCVTQVGEQSVNVARNAVLSSRLPDSVPGVTIDRQCGSSQQAIHFAAQAIQSGAHDLIVAAGVESMSRLPIASAITLAAKAGLGTGPVSSAMAKRLGSSDVNQFQGAELLSRKYGLSREEMDRYALESHHRAAFARDAGLFKEIVPVPLDGGAHVADEGIRTDASLEAMAGLNPLLEGGLVTAANASQICDGASAVLVVSERALKQHGLTAIARVDAMAITAGDPVLMVGEPIGATRRIMEKYGRQLSDIDLVEINEAFAAVPLAWMQEFGIDPAIVNIHGGAIALGHPLGASGAKLAATLIAALGQHKLRYGLQLMCEGGGLANATIFERL